MNEVITNEEIDAYYGRKNYWVVLISYLGSYFILSFLAVIALQIFAMFFLPELVDDALKTYLQVGSSIAMGAFLLLMCGIFLHTDMIRDITDIGKGYNSLKYIGIAILGFFIMVISTSVLGLIYQQLNIVDNADNQQAILDMIELGYVPHVIVLTLIMAPIYEELIFRKCIFGLIKNKWLALLVSSGIFGIIHIVSTSDWVMLPLYLIPGVFLGLVYILSNKNIFASWLVHLANNSLSILIIFLPQFL